MDVNNAFGEPDPSAAVSQHAIDLEAIAEADGSERPQLFSFAVVDDTRPRDGVARKAMTKFFAFREILKDPEQLEDQGVEFREWFKDKRLKTKDERKETHVALNFGSFHIPPEQESLFLERYAIGLAQGRPFWLVERPTPVFRLFFDLDFKNLGILTGAGIEAAALVAGKSVSQFFPLRDEDDSSQNLRMIVCCTDIKKDTIEGPSGKVNVHKTGVHLHWPNIFVTGEQAMTIREMVLSQMTLTFGPRVPPQQNSWEDVIDSSVFQREGREGSGLRMQGSRKSETCPDCKGKLKNADGTWKKCSNPRCRCGKVDSGRPYALLFATDGTLRRNADQEIAYTKDLFQLVSDISIRSQKNYDEVEDGSEGFVVPAGAPRQVGKKKDKVVKGPSIGASGNQTARTVQPNAQYEVLQDLIRHAFGDRYSQVVVSTVKQQVGDKSQIVNVTGMNAHQCQNISREHKSNRIQFVVSLDGVVQRCYDPTDTISDEMKWGLCKHQASDNKPLSRKQKDLLFPKVIDDHTSTASLAEAPIVGPHASKQLKSLLIYGDFLCNRLFGSTWSITLSLDTHHKILRTGSAIGLVGAEDLGIKSRKALVDLGFAKEEPPEIAEKTKTVRFEVPLSELEESMQKAFSDWVNSVIWLDEATLQKLTKKTIEKEVLHDEDYQEMTRKKRKLIDVEM